MAKNDGLVKGPKTPSEKKLYRGGPNPISKYDRRDTLRQEADGRAQERALRSPEEQLDVLATRPGESLKESLRLKQIIVEDGN